MSAGNNGSAPKAPLYNPEDFPSSYFTLWRNDREFFGLHLGITALIFGLAYGAAVIVEEAKKGHLAKEELERLPLSMGINQAISEDLSLFLARHG